MTKLKLISSEIVHIGDYLKHREDVVETATGARFSLPVLEHPGACVIIAKYADKLILVKQHRHAIGSEIWEFPAGKLNKSEVIIDCAKRELQEETGYISENWKELGLIYPAPGFSDEVQYLFFADNSRFLKQDLDEDEELSVHLFEIEEVEKMISSGEMTDAKSIAIFARARACKLI